MQKLEKLKKSIAEDLYVEFAKESVPYNFIKKLNDGKFDDFFSNKNIVPSPADLDIVLPNHFENDNSLDKFFQPLVENDPFRDPFFNT